MRLYLFVRGCFLYQIPKKRIFIEFFLFFVHILYIHNSELNLFFPTSRFFLFLREQLVKTPPFIHSFSWQIFNHFFHRRFESTLNRTQPKMTNAERCNFRKQIQCRKDLCLKKLRTVRWGSYVDHLPYTLECFRLR